MAIQDASLKLLNRHLLLFNAAIDKLLKELDLTSVDFFAPQSWIPDPTLENRFKLPGFFKLEKLQQKPCGQRSRAINVYITGQISLGSERGTISFFGTKIQYCRYKSQADLNTLKVASGFHFDIDTSCPIHPTFHMQHDQSILVAKLEDELKIKVELPIDPETENKDARFPTAQMDIFSAIIMVIADHCIDQNNPKHIDSFKNFLKNVSPFIPKISNDYNTCIPKTTTEITEWYRAVAI